MYETSFKECLEKFFEKNTSKMQEFFLNFKHLDSHDDPIDKSCNSNDLESSKIFIWKEIEFSTDKNDYLKNNESQMEIILSNLPIAKRRKIVESEISESIEKETIESIKNKTSESIENENPSLQKDAFIFTNEQTKTNSSWNNYDLFDDFVECFQPKIELNIETISNVSFLDLHQIYSNSSQIGLGVKCFYLYQLKSKCSICGFKFCELHLQQFQHEPNLMRMVFLGKIIHAFHFILNLNVLQIFPKFGIYYYYKKKVQIENLFKLLKINF
jgi:hypothetical protein